MFPSWPQTPFLQEVAMCHHSVPSIHVLLCLMPLHRIPFLPSLFVPLAFTLSRLFFSPPGRVGLHLLHNEMIAFLWCVVLLLVSPSYFLQCDGMDHRKTHRCCSSSDSMNWAAHVSCAEAKVQFWQVSPLYPLIFILLTLTIQYPRAQGWIQVPWGSNPLLPPTRRAFSSFPF